MAETVAARKARGVMRLVRSILVVGLLKFERMGSEMVGGDDEMRG